MLREIDLKEDYDRKYSDSDLIKRFSQYMSPFKTRLIIIVSLIIQDMESALV